eukprot:jgi/Botrbrau1/13658/Bobra.0292s0008.2
MLEAFPLTQLPLDICSNVLRFLCATQLIAASGACKALAEASEPAFKSRCMASGWKMPRRPRGIAAGFKHFPWRSLYWRHSCVSCGEAGQFVVRRCHDGCQLYLICRGCIGEPKARARLQAEFLYVDLFSIEGHRLLRKRSVRTKGRRFATLTV